MTESQEANVCTIGLPEILGRLLCSYLHLASGADEVSGKSWQLVAAVHDEGAGLTFCG